MRQYIKRCLAVIMAAAMTAALVPAGTAGLALAAGGEDVEAALKPVLHYDMSHENGKLTDVSGNGKDGTLHGFDETADFGSDGENGQILTFDGNNKYVDIPAGVITGETFAIEAVYTTTTKSAAWLFALGTGAAKWQDVNNNYLFVSPCSGENGSYYDAILAAISRSGEEKRYPSSKVLKGYNDDRENIVTVVFNNGNVTYYLNGMQSEVTESGFKIQEILSADNNNECIGYIGKSLYSGDPYFVGTLKDFKIYDQPLTEHLYNDAKERLKSVMMNKNTDADNIAWI